MKTPPFERVGCDTRTETMDIILTDDLEEELDGQSHFGHEGARVGSRDKLGSKLKLGIWDGSELGG